MDIREKINLARQAVRRMCNGEQFRMSIPANEETDHDMIICRALGGAIEEIESQATTIARLEAELERMSGEREAWIGGMLAVGAMRWQPHRAEFCLDIRDIEGMCDERERNAVKAAIAKVHRGCFRDHSDAALSARQNGEGVVDE